MVAYITRRYSGQGLRSLFLICAFPLHFWALILSFRDLGWVAERTNAWDAAGVASYGMVFAFVESAAVFLVVVLLGFLVPLVWDNDRQIALLSVLVLAVSLWAMADQLFFLLGISLPGQMVHFLARTTHPLRVLYVAALAVVVPTMLIPAVLVLRSSRVLKFIRGLIERLSLLTSFYLLFDLAGLVVVILRNI